MSSSTKKDAKKDTKSSSKNDDPVPHRRQKSNSTADASSGKKSSVLRTNAQATSGRNPATTRDNRTGLPDPKAASSTRTIQRSPSATSPAATRAAPANAEPQGPIVKTRETPLSQSKYAGSAGSPSTGQNAGAGAAGGAPGAASANGGFGSMGPNGFASAGPQGYGGSMGPSGYGSMGPGGYGSMGAGGYGSMGPGSQMDMQRTGSFQGNPYGSMGPGAMGSQMGGMGSQMDMQRTGSFQGNPYGSMGPGSQMGMGSQMGGMGSQMQGGSMMNPYGSMAGGMPNSMYGQGGSMYGMDPAMGGGSMYGMNPMMGSMYGMGGPMMGGSMYGMNPMMGGSMYGMNPMMGSMMGGPMGSMYGMGGSQYMLGRYNSMGLGSNYGSFYNVFRTDSARHEFEPSGGYSGAMGLFTAPENFKTRRKVDPMPEASSALSSEGAAKNDSRSAPAKKIDAADASKSRSAPSKDDDAKRDGSSATKADDDKSGASKARSVSDPADKDKDGKDKSGDNAGKTGDEANTASPTNKSRGGVDLSKIAAKTEPGVHRTTKSVNDSVHAIAVVEDKSFIDSSDPKKVKTPDGKSFTMDEVMLLSDFTVDGSDLLVDVTEHANCGHNVALLAVCGKASITAAEKVAKAVVSRAVELNKSNESAGEKVTIWANAAAFPQAGQCRDLLSKPTEMVPKEATYGTSPIFGPRVTNVTDAEIKTTTEAEDVIAKAANATTDEEMAYVLFTIKQMRNPSPENVKKGNKQPEVYLSSFLVAFFRDANMAYLPAIRHRSHTTFPGILFTQAVGGACRTVVIVPVCKAESRDPRSAILQQGETMREVKNGSVRSGNVSRFLEFTEQAVTKGEAAKEKPAVIAQRRQMATDAKELIAGEPAMKPKVYEAKISSSSAATGPTRNLTNDKTVRVALVVENADLSSVSDKDKATVVVAQNKEAEVDELMYHKKNTDYPKSDLMARTTGALMEGLNTAVLSVEGVSSVKFQDRFTWTSFKSTISDTLASCSKNGDACEVHLYMSVVHQRQVLADLLDEANANAAPMALVVVSSPIVGPIVHNTKCTILKSDRDVAPVVDAALGRAAPFITKDDAMVVAVAVAKTVRQKDKDVCMAALFTASAPTPDPFVGLLEEDNRYSRSLFSFAISGPCTTTVVLVEDKAKLTDPATATKLGQVKKVASKQNLPNRDGGVRRFTAQASQSLERANAKVSEAKSATERQHYERNVKKLPIMIEDHTALLNNPADASIPIYMPDGTRPPTSGTRSVPTAGGASAAPTGATDAQSVVVVLAQSGLPTDGVKLDLENKAVTAKAVSCSPTELIEMTGASLRSSHVDSIVTLALSGYNTAMLTADTAGSTVGRSLVTRSVRMLLGKVTDKSEVYWSVAVLRNGKMKDMLATSASYTDIHIASSPIFGPCLDGASFVKLDAAGSGVEEALKAAATERAYAGGVVLATVVPKIVQEDGKDVLMPSMFLTIAGDDMKVYDSPLSVDQRHRGIFHYVFGGPCYTLFVAGIKPTEVDTTDTILKTCNEIMKIKNPPLRSGSVLRFVEHSEPKLKALQGKLATSEGSEKSALSAQAALMEKMVTEAKNLIANPVNCVPPTYSNPKNRS